MFNLLKLIYFDKNNNKLLEYWFLLIQKIYILGIYIITKVNIWHNTCLRLSMVYKYLYDCSSIFLMSNFFLTSWFHIILIILCWTSVKWIIYIGTCRVGVDLVAYIGIMTLIILYCCNYYEKQYCWFILNNFIHVIKVWNYHHETDVQSIRPIVIIIILYRTLNIITRLSDHIICI